jgi:hypothetical protein
MTGMLNDDERYFKAHSAFFAASDGIVNETAENFVNEVQYAGNFFMVFK